MQVKNNIKKQNEGQIFDSSLSFGEQSLEACDL